MRSSLGISWITLICAFSGFTSHQEARAAGFLTHPLADSSVAVYNGWLYRDTGAYHGATDYKANQGTAVLAAADGWAIASCQPPLQKASASDPDTYGNFVLIDHQNGYSTLYAHLDSVAVSQVPCAGRDSISRGNIQYGGQTYLWKKVQRGDQIGTVGMTGTSYFHLHFEAALNASGSYSVHVNNRVDSYAIYGEYNLYPPPAANCGNANTSAYLWTSCPVSGAESASGFCVGCGAPSSAISSIFQSAFNLEGASVLGKPTSQVIAYTDTFYSPAISGYYQNFVDASGRNMSLQLLQGASQAFSVKWGFSDLYSKLSSYKNHKVYDLVVAPTSNEISYTATAASVAGTKYTWQPFKKGSMVYFNFGGFATQGWQGQSEYVWGEFADRYSQEGGLAGPLGLPITEAASDATADGWDWWYQWFERGLILRAQAVNNGSVWTFAIRKASDVTNSTNDWTYLNWVQHQ